MLVNVTDVFTSEGKSSTVRFTCPITEVVHEGTAYRLKECSTVSLKLSGMEKGKALAEVSLHVTAMLACDRCLSEVEYPFDLTIVREVVSPEIATDDEREEQDSFMEGYALNIDRLIENEIMLSWPMKVLCRPDCKGLCPVCGKDLNTGACGCDTFVPDPRMAAIMDAFYANKEV